MRHKHHLPRHRPPWWPANEPWPPPKGRFRRSPFSKRLGCLFLLFNLLGFLFFILVLSVGARLLGFAEFPGRHEGWLFPLVLFLLVVGAISWGVARVRHMSRPLDDLLEASQRVAKGDYSARVEEQGVSEIRSVAKAFNAMAERLQVSDQQRRALLADVTHELRTPLTVVQGNLEGMLDGVYPADETQLKAILEETQILSRLIDDLRTLALSESGALQLKREPTDLAVLIGETVAAFRSRAEAAGVRLEVEAKDDLPLLDVDPERIHQVLSNLIANALRYTPGGGWIEVRYRAGVVIEVEDSGAGIPAEELPRVFERFYKSRDSGGMGLGLAIARRLVEAHGGTIRAESEPGRGTRMRIKLPG
ncbi:MAG: sensor histidine kinase [Chloroflexota bacterium]